MKEQNVYFVDVARSDTAPIRVKIAATSSSVAKAFVARTMITARRAKNSELLGMDPSTVIDAETGRPLFVEAAQDDQLPLLTASESIEQAATRLATEGGARELPAFLRADTPAVNTGD